MPRILFTGTPKLPKDLKHLDYHKGDVVDLPDDQANRWIRRGVAETAPADAKVSRATDRSSEAAPPVEIPDGWQNMRKGDRIILARQLTTDVVKDAASADEVIAAELARREGGAER